MCYVYQTYIVKGSAVSLEWLFFVSRSHQKYICQPVKLRCAFKYSKSRGLLTNAQKNHVWMKTKNSDAKSWTVSCFLFSKSTFFGTLLMHFKGLHSQKQKQKITQHQIRLAATVLLSLSKKQNSTMLYDWQSSFLISAFPYFWSIRNRMMI